MKSILFLALIVSVGAFAVPTTLNIVELSETAAAPAENSGDNVNGNRVANVNGDVFFLLRNSHVSDSATVTVTAQATSIKVPGFGAATKSNATVALSAGQEKHVGPFRAKAWNDTSGYVQLAFSGAASSSVKVTPLRMPKSF